MLTTASPYQMMPPLTKEEGTDLKADLAANGMRVPVDKDEDGNLLDGHHRAELWGELRTEGVVTDDYPERIHSSFNEDQKRAFVRSTNLLRRHLTQEQHRLIGDQLRDTPEISDRQVAEQFGVDHKTVAPVRKGLEERGEIPHVEKRTDTKGRAQPSTKPRAKKKPQTQAPAPQLLLHEDDDDQGEQPALGAKNYFDKPVAEAALLGSMLEPDAATVELNALRDKSHVQNIELVRAKDEIAKLKATIKSLEAELEDYRKTAATPNAADPVAPAATPAPKDPTKKPPLRHHKDQQRGYVYDPTYTKSKRHDRPFKTKWPRDQAQPPAALVQEYNAWAAQNGW